MLSYEDAVKINDTHTMLMVEDKIPGDQCGVIELEMVLEAIYVIAKRAQHDWEAVNAPLEGWETELLRGVDNDFDTADQYEYTDETFHDPYYERMYYSWDGGF